MNDHLMKPPLGLVCLAVFAVLALVAVSPGEAEAQEPSAPKVLTFCYVPQSGAVYIIKEPGMPEECRNDNHVQFSWTEGTQDHDHGALNGKADDDHPQYLLADGSRALAGNLAAGGNKVTGLGAGTAAGDAVRYEQAVKSGDAAGGDLGGTYPNPRVDGLQGNPVAPSQPADGDALVWDNSSGAWSPSPVGGGLSNPEIVTDKAVFTEPGLAWLYANCPAGKIAINGGHGIQRNYGGYNEYKFYVADHPDNDGRSWYAEVWVGFVSDDPVGGLALHVYVYALCVDIG